MNRIIKFRVAIKTKEGIKFDYYKLEDIDGYSGKTKSGMIGGELLGRDEFTGLKDKNGVEIYEGDIIEGDGVKHEVKFIDGCFSMVNKNTTDCLDRKWESDEAIGNIYQNKELLK